ncbi:MAG: hypothetical protein ACI4FX_03065 [Agathobacter sp.]
MVNKKNFLSFRDSAPLQAEFLYVHAKDYTEAMDTKVGMELDTKKHFNFKHLLKKYEIVSGHDSLYDDCKEIIRIWETQIAE